MATTPARARRVLALLRAAHPDAGCELEHRDPFQLLCATILSAQCTDRQVNRVLPALFARYPDAAALARAPLRSLEALIRSTGFFRTKARHLRDNARRLVAHFDGRVPDSREALVTLPGVGRKTAHVVLGTAFGHQALVVDTHVARLAWRLGFTDAAAPLAIERDLARVFPEDSWTDLGHLLIFHGRRVCGARAPACERCSLAPHCRARVTGRFRRAAGRGNAGPVTVP